MASQIDAADAAFASLAAIADVDVITQYAELTEDPNQEEADFPEPGELEAAELFCLAARRRVMGRTEAP